MHLERIERFYFNGKFLIAFRTPYSLLIRGLCNQYGFSPDCITKRVSFDLICDDDLPF